MTDAWLRETAARTRRIPEHVASIGTATHPSGTHGGLVPVADRAHEVEESEADRSLELVIALDPDIGVRPAARPGGPLLDQESVEARRFGFDQVSNGVDDRRRPNGLGAVGRESVEPSSRATRRSRFAGGGRYPCVVRADAHRYPPPHRDRRSRRLQPEQRAQGRPASGDGVPRHAGRRSPAGRAKRSGPPCETPPM